MQSGEMTDYQYVKDELRARATCVIIPTYNNVGSIRSVVADALQYCKDVMVVCDGCTDGTTEIVKSIEGIIFVSYEKNRGKGYALKTGFRKALELGFAYAITMDADGQHYAKDIPSFLSASKANPGALIIGKRQMKGVVRSKGSSFANKFSNFWFFVQTWVWLDDTQTGYRLYPLKKLPLSLLTARYEAELTLLVFSSWRGVPLVSIPVDVFYPAPEERVSHFRPFKDFGRISVLNTVLCLVAIVYGLPARCLRFLLRMLRTGYAIFIFLFYHILIGKTSAFVTSLFMKDERRQKTLQKVAYFQARFFTIWHGVPGVKFSFAGKENAGIEKPRIIICNHQTYFDSNCINVLFPNLIFLTNDWVWESPFFGDVVRGGGNLRASDGIDALMPKIRKSIKKKLNLLIFPEGTRTKTGEVGRFHKGAFYVAQKLSLEIQPLLIYSGNVLKKGAHSLHPGRIHVEMLPPLTRDELDAMGDDREQTHFVHALIVKEYNNLRNKLDQDA